MCVLAAALRLAVHGTHELYGYELFAQLSAWEGRVPMNHGTLYRCLRALEGRGFFETRVIPPSDGPARVGYSLTDAGVAAARRCTVRLAGEDEAPSWIDIGNALPDALRLGSPS